MRHTALTAPVNNGRARACRSPEKIVRQFSSQCVVNSLFAVRVCATLQLILCSHVVPSVWINILLLLSTRCSWRSYSCKHTITQTSSYDESKLTLKHSVSVAHFNLRNFSVTILDGFITHDQHAPIDILAVPRNDGHCLSCFGRLQVSLTQVHTFANFIVHHIRMTDLETGHEHRVTHLNFTTWPDLGTPKSAIPLLQVGVLSLWCRVLPAGLL